MIKNKDYGSLLLQDATGILKSAINAQLVGSRDDGRFTVNMKMSDITPWAFVKNTEALKCFLWHNVYFDHCGFIPSPCHSCYKIVVRPANLRAAMQFYDMMYELDYPGKIGWEDRKTVFGNFGAYFYNRSLQEAQAKLPFIQEKASRIDLLPNPFEGDVFTPIIKRGCTEFEYKFGRSDQWEITEKQKIKENILDKVMVFNNHLYPQPDHRVATTMRLWVHNAYAVGDPTVADFTKRLFPKYITYQERDNV